MSNNLAVVINMVAQNISDVVPLEKLIKEVEESAMFYGIDDKPVINMGVVSVSKSFSLEELEEEFGEAFSDTADFLRNLGLFMFGKPIKTIYFIVEATTNPKPLGLRFEKDAIVFTRYSDTMRVFGEKPHYLYETVILDIYEKKEEI